jgi:ABC-type multidrug transport system permease subunit
MTMTALRLAWRDFVRLLRHPVTLVWAFVMPVVFFSFIGKITGRMGPDPQRKDVIGVLLPADAGLLGDALLRHLGAAGYDVRRASTAADLAKFSRQLTVPPGLTAAVLAAKPQRLQFRRQGEPGIGGDYDKIRLSRAVYGLLAEIIAAERQRGKLSQESLDAIAAQPRNLAIEISAAGKRRDPPSGYQQSVPGILVMFILMVMLTSGGISIVLERRAGILRRLGASPQTRGSIVAAKWGSRFALAVVQTAVGAALGTVLYGIEWGEAPWAAAALLAAYAALCGSIGLWLGSLARSEGQASAIGVIAGNLLAALGGCWWPAEVSPQWMQQAALFLPTGLTMDGLHRLMSFGEPASAVAPHLAALLAAALLVSWLAARAFRFE